MIGRALRDPLVHFLAIGAVIFGVHCWVDASAGAAPRDARIVVSTGRLAQLRETFTAKTRRTPTQQEMEGLVEAYVREEILVRESVRVGFDRDDSVIRDRLVEKYLFLQDARLPSPAPTDADLARLLAEAPEQFRSEDRYSFAHVLVSAARRRDETAKSMAADLLVELRAKDVQPEQADAYGDTATVSHSIADGAEPDVARELGADFAKALRSLTPGTWQGPIRSQLGYHLVRVTGRTLGPAPVPSAVRGEVEARWRSLRRQEAVDAAYVDLRKGYDVVVEKADEPR